jgi:tRNA dimethylallyltransferase
MFLNLKKFINKKTNLSKIIVIYWPTACGKTNLSIDIAKFLKTEIISTDSRQIYKYLNIWTWKITKKEMVWIKHHMINIIDINKDYSVWEYKKNVEKIINSIQKKWKIPILCWWTGLYIDSIIYNFNIPEVPPDWQYRDKLEKIRIKKWNDFLWEMLNKVDPNYAKTLSSNNYRYVIRWLEVFTKTWKSKLNFWEKLEKKYDILFLTPFDWNREILYKKINERIEKMFDQWLINEVKKILKKWYTKNDFWLNTIWYKEVIDYINWEIDLSECKKLVAQHNRNYAKRQLTWFKKYKNI